MKGLKRLLTILSVVTMLFMVSITVAADGTTVDSGKGGSGSITVQQANPKQTYAFYRIFEAIPNSDGSSVSYKLLSEKSMPTNSYFIVDASGNVSATDTAKKLIEDSNGKKPGQEGYINTYGNELSDEAITWLSSKYSTLGESVFSTTTPDGNSTNDLTVTHLLLGIIMLQLLLELLFPLILQSQA